MRKFYHVVDRVTSDDLAPLNAMHKSMRVIDKTTGERVKLMAMATGEKRCPKSGEWFLSGAEIEAYRAPKDLATVYRIARLVRVVEIKLTVEE